MAYLRNKDTTQVIGPLTDDSAEYLYLQGKRDASNRPIWEDVGTQEAGTAAAQRQDTAQVLFDAVAAGNDANAIIGKAPYSGTVAAVTYYPNAAVTGANTNSRTLTSVNLAAGAGSTNVATLALVSGTNLTANAANQLTLNGTAANLNVNSGDEIQFVSTHVGTGIADPGGLVVVTFQREA